MAISSRESTKRRAQRNRNRLRTVANGRPRLSVFRSAKNIYAQVIDDAAGRTVASASSRDREIRSGLGFGGNRQAAEAIGRALAERARAAGVTKVCFDRGEFRYHGRVAALADAARAGGLEF